MTLSLITINKRHGSSCHGAYQIIGVKTCVVFYAHSGLLSGLIAGFGGMRLTHTIAIEGLAKGNTHQRHNHSKG